MSSFDYFDEEEALAVDLSDGGIPTIGEGTGDLVTETGDVIFISAKLTGIGSIYI